jgi:hypothetical protein
MRAKRVFHTVMCGSRKWPTLVMTHPMTAGCPLALARMLSLTKALENMKGWNCNPASRIQNRPRMICRVRWVFTRWGNLWAA